MSCPPADRVLDFLARRLDARGRDELEAHVDGCEDCRALLVELARTEPDPPGGPTELESGIEIAREREPAAVGRYRIEARLGEGGMGTVYAAHDPQLDRRVAVKLVHPELAARGGLERLLREGRALARLSHPNVVAVYDAGTDGDRVYVAMELVEGEPLAAWLRAPRGWREIAEKLAAAARGLAAAHAAGIVHRDVKPENVLLDRAGVAKVADFGLAGAAAVAPAADAPIDPASRLTHPGAVVGTPAFMSPEQRRGGDVGPASDQYSLCAALSSALFDERPARRIPRWLRRALERGLSAEPAARFPSIDALAHAIDPAVRARRARTLALAGGAALAAAAVAITLALGSSSGDPGDPACEAAAGARTALWTAADRTAIAAALRATGAPYAEETWQRVDAAAAQYTAQLATATAAHCEHAPRTDQARVVRTLGLACLAERRAALATLTAQLRRAGPTDVRRAVADLHALPSTEDCTAEPALLAERDAHATPARAAARTAITAELTAARAASADGRHREAAAHARRAEGLARPLGGAVLAKALLTVAEVAPPVEGMAAAEAAAREAATAADAGRADGLRAFAMTSLASSLARTPGREKEALAMRPLVEAAIDRGGKRAALLPVLQQAVGAAHLRLGQTEPALESFRDALDAARAAVPPGDPRLPLYIYPVGLALDHLGRATDALAYYDEAHRAAIDVWGANHPEVARFAINVATKHGALGEYDRALGELAASRAALTGALPPDAAELLQIAEVRGACLQALRRYDEALAEHAGRQRALEAAGRGKSAELAASWTDIGDVYRARGDAAAAEAAYHRALDGYRALLGADDVRTALPLARLGELALDAGRPGPALEQLERAHAIFTAAQATSFVAAEAALPLARALWEQRPTDRARARALARSARDAFATAGGFYEDRRREAERWLAEHGAAAD